jgi:hypothetical protein
MFSAVPSVPAASLCNLVVLAEDGSLSKPPRRENFVIAILDVEGLSP